MVCVVCNDTKKLPIDHKVFQEYIQKQLERTKDEVFARIWFPRIVISTYDGEMYSICPECDKFKEI